MKNFHRNTFQISIWLTWHQIMVWGLICSKITMKLTVNMWIMQNSFIQNTNIVLLYLKMWIMSIKLLKYFALYEFCFFFYFSIFLHFNVITGVFSLSCGFIVFITTYIRLYWFDLLIKVWNIKHIFQALEMLSFDLYCLCSTFFNHVHSTGS